MQRPRGSTNWPNMRRSTGPRRRRVSIPMRVAMAPESRSRSRLTASAAVLFEDLLDPLGGPRVRAAGPLLLQQHEAAGGAVAPAAIQGFGDLLEGQVGQA